MKRIIYLILGMLAMLSLTTNAQAVKALGSQKLSSSPSGVAEDVINATTYSSLVTEKSLLQVPSSPEKITHVPDTMGMNIRVYVEKDNLYGTIIFTLPTTESVTHEPINETYLRYLVMAGTKPSNQEQIAEGVGKCGQEISVDFEFTSPGMKMFSIACGSLSSNNLNNYTFYWTLGEANEPTSWEGFFLKKINDNTVELSWGCPQSGSQGWINPEKVSYWIERNGQFLAEDVSEQTFTDVIESDVQSSVYYEIGLMEYDGTIGSPRITLGPPSEIPYSNSFENVSYFNLMGQSSKSSWQYNYLDKCAEFIGSGKVDTLFTPPISFEPGVYKLSFNCLNGNLPTSLTISFNQDYNPSSTLCQLMDAAICTSLNTNDYDSYFKVDEATTGYIAFGAFDSWLKLLGLSIERLPSADIPASCTEISATPLEDGAMAAVIKLTTPNVNIVGDPLGTELTKVELYRDDSILIHTFVTPNPSTELTFIDTGLSRGLVTYKAIPFTSAGQGVACNTSVFIGEDIPLTPDSAWITIEGNNVIMHWNETTQGENNGWIGDISYLILDENANILIENLKGTSYTIENVDLTGSQRFLTYSVACKNEVSYSRYLTPANPIVIGDALQMPYIEPVSESGIQSFAGSYSQTNTVFDNWIMSPKSSNNDNACFGYEPFTQGIWSDLCLPVIEFNENTNPQLSFDILTTLMDCSVQPYFVEGFAGNWIPLGEPITFNWSTSEKWTKKSINLKSITQHCTFGRIVFRATSESIAYEDGFYIDNLKIKDFAENDLSISVSTPESIRPSESLPITATITNEGSNVAAAGSYKVNFYKDGNLFISLVGRTLKADESEDYTINIEGISISDDIIECYATVDYDIDGILSNNVSDTKSIQVLHSVYPAVIDLNGNNTGTSVELEWSNPDYENLSLKMTITDGVESYKDGDNGGITTQSMTGMIGPWMVVDQTYYYGSQYMGQNNTFGCPMGFMVFNSSTEKPMYQKEQYKPHQGVKCFGSWLNDSGDDWADNNHWLISPILTGEAQTFSFYAKNGIAHAGTGAKMWVGYTTVDDLSVSPQFTALTDLQRVYGGTGTDAWQYFEYTLPEGAKHFAIRDISDQNAGYILMLDDITYTAVVDTTLTLLGYNVYRDGALLAELRTEGNGAKYNVYRDGVLMAENVPAANYVDEPEEDGVYTYQVTAVYAEGESAPSNKVRIVFVKGTPTGVSDIDAGRHVVSRRYVNPAGMVSDTPFDGVNIVVTTLDDGTTRTTKVVR